ncbi:MAG TPA: hypothetical protein VFG43_11090, partial [Geminicoccaceae bacterium]|nr:hypothetical protein [Geminicoccaceae bacterium]
MRRVLCATAAVLMLGCLGTARAGECVPFASGEILCEEGDAVLYFDPATEQWQDVTAELQVLQQLGLLAGLGM